MRMAVRGLALLAAAALIAGCGGGGGSHSSGAVVQSPFMGQWTGSWTDTNGNHGVLETTVAAGGQMTVSLTEQGQGLAGEGQGTVHGDGAFNITYSWEGGQGLTGAGTFVHSSDTTVNGTMVIKQGGQNQGSATFTLNKQ